MNNDVYTRVTDQIVSAIEAGAGTWRMPWHVRACDADTAFPYNALTKRHYRGVNVLALWAAQQSRGYATPVWATYRQWQERGAQVRKDERASVVVFWKFDRIVSQDGDDDTGTGRTSVFARASAVFNAAQVDGYEAPAPTPIVEPERDAACETYFRSLGADVRHGGGKAYYQPGADYIQMPMFAAFDAPCHYYSTLAHEHVHWTSHKSRCERELGKRFGDEAYAMEELIAELGAAFTCANLRLDSEPRPDHAAYIQSWLRVLRNDKRAIFTAASKAQQAVDWMMARHDAATLALAA